MQKIVIKLGLLAVVLLTALPAVAQEQRPTLRDVNAIPQAQIDILNAGGENLMAADITANIFDTTFVGTELTFEAVILTDPRKSGLSNVTDGRVDRVHMFVRDTSAATLGPDGMGIQVVDGAYDTNDLLSFGVGDVIQVTAGITPFGTAMQVSPTSITLIGDVTSLGLPESILDPIVITTDEANSVVGTDGVQVNWNNLARLRNAYVRIEDATIQTRNLANPDRPDFYISTDGGTTVLNFYDTGLQFRNDRQGVYPSEFLGRVDDMGDDEDFVPPPPGSLVNMQGVLIFQGGADQIGRGVPANGLLSIAPFEGDLDLELLESPPVISDVTGPDFVPDGSEAVSITFLAQADPTRTLTANACEYVTSESTDIQTVDAMQSGDVLACDIPAQADGVFVTYTVVSTDNTGAQSLSDPGSYRTLVDGINSIEDVQLTVDEGPGDSPFVGISTDMDITAYVVSDPSTSGLTVVQEDTDLNGWTGVFLSTSETLAMGDMINITNATIEERFGVTQLADLTMSVVSSGNAVPDYKVVPTTALLDDGVAEAHEGMLLRFDNVVIGANPDDPSDFGEWSFASSGTEDFIRADDASAGIASDFNASLAPETELDFIRGVWWFSFGNYKLVPESIADLMGGGVANEDEILPNSFALDQNYPNPFNPTTTISYQVPANGLVKLEVFDLLGRSVGVLVNETVSAGQYTVDFNAANLSSGVYLYRLSAGEHVETRKMLLMK
ncbi:MAG: T9SS type A sorting domain-containing protein [Rhodothermaceae bacterium]|nr:T9SS type A sorting domain-containing protein [Rhodothermaceae bacterium]